MEQLVREGKISYVGSSNFAAWDVALAQSAASNRHFLGLVSEQSLYNLAVRTVELELIPALRSLGIGLIPYSPLHAGLLAGALASRGRRAQPERACSRRSTAHRDQLEAYEDAVPRVGRQPRRTSRWPGSCRTRSSRPRSSGPTTTEELAVEPRRARRCSWTTSRHRAARPRSGRGQEKHRRPTPGEDARLGVRRHSGSTGACRRALHRILGRVAAPRLVFLYGPPAVGKLTVARAIADRLPFKILHNHVTIDAVKEVLPFGSDPFWECRQTLQARPCRSRGQGRCRSDLHVRVRAGR